jgi:PmbA protein
MTSTSRVLSKFDPEGAASFAGQIAKMAVKSEPIKTGKYDIIMEPLVAGNVLERVMDSTSIFSVEANLSFFINQLNKKVGSNNVTLYDDATLPNGLSSSKYDDEGTPRKRTKVIDRGVLKTYLHNYSTSKKYKVENTANAGLISPSSSNSILEKGDFSKEELFKEMKTGLYLTNTWYTRFNNYSTGDFSTIPRDGAFFVKDGEIKHAVRQIRISDNMLNILKNISAIGKKEYFMKSWEIENPVVTPPILVKNVNITRPLG